MENIPFKAYINSAMTNGSHIYQTSYDIAMETMCTYPPYQHTLPQFKFVLRCCDNLPSIDLTSQ